MTLTTTRIAQETQARTQLRVPMVIDVFQAQTTAGTVFTARSDADFEIRSLIASNVSASVDYITVYLVPDGGTAGATNMIVYQKAVPAKDWVAIFDATNVGYLPPGASIQVLDGVNDSVNVFGWGYEYQGAYG